MPEIKPAIEKDDREIKKTTISQAARKIILKKNNNNKHSPTVYNGLQCNCWVSFPALILSPPRHRTILPHPLHYVNATHTSNPALPLVSGQNILHVLFIRWTKVSGTKQIYNVSAKLIHDESNCRFAKSKVFIQPIKKREKTTISQSKARRKNNNNNNKTH